MQNAEFYLMHNAQCKMLNYFDRRTVEREVQDVSR